MYEIGPFEVSDLLSVAGLASRVLPEAYPPEFFLRMHAIQGDHFRVAREVETGRVAGFILATKQPGLRGNILMFGVDPAAQGQGVGRALLRDVQQGLALDNVRTIDLEVRPDNSRAIEFYQRQGFFVAELEEGVYQDGGDALLMTKALF